MSNWYTVAIAFLGGVAIGLLAFLFVKPADTASHSDNRTPQQEEQQEQQVEEAEKSVASETDNVTPAPQDESEGQDTGSSSSSPSKKEKWEGEIDSASSNPELIFYYKPG